MQANLLNSDEVLGDVQLKHVADKQRVKYTYLAGRNIRRNCSRQLSGVKVGERKRVEGSSPFCDLKGRRYIRKRKDVS